MKECNDRTFVLSVFVSLLSLVSARSGTRVLWTETRGDAGFIVSANADGSSPTDIVSGAANIKGPNGLEYYNRQLFWPDQQLNAVQKANPDGTGVTTVYVTSNPYDVFATPERVYWSSKTGNYIFTSKPDGSDLDAVHSRNTITSPFALEIVGSTCYWSDVSGLGKIMRSDLNGANIQTILDRVVIYDMQISGDFIYFGDNSFTPGMKKVKLDGTGLTKLFDADFVNGIWLTADTIYWSDLNSIHQAGYDGSNAKILYTATAGNQVRGVVVLEDATSVTTQPMLGNPQRIGNNFTFTVLAKAGTTINIEKTSAPGAAWNQVTSFVAGKDPKTVSSEVPAGVKTELFRAKTQ